MTFNLLSGTQTEHLCLPCVDFASHLMCRVDTITESLKHSGVIRVAAAQRHSSALIASTAAAAADKDV